MKCQYCKIENGPYHTCSACFAKEAAGACLHVVEGAGWEIETSNEDAEPFKTNAPPSESFYVLTLRRRKRNMISYLKTKTEEEDWHGVQDAASDLRDIESEMVGYDKAKKNERAARND